jgi:hypothetical protein
MAAKPVTLYRCPYYGSSSRMPELVEQTWYETKKRLRSIEDHRAKGQVYLNKSSGRSFTGDGMLWWRTPLEAVECALEGAKDKISIRQSEIDTLSIKTSTLTELKADLLGLPPRPDDDDGHYGPYGPWQLYISPSGDAWWRRRVDDLAGNLGWWYEHHPPPTLDGPCPHEARNGVHEVYVTRRGTLCRACGARPADPSQTAGLHNVAAVDKAVEAGRKESTNG